MNNKLTTLQINNLFSQYKNNNSNDVRDKLYNHFSKIPNMIALRFSGRGIEHEDIVQVASVSLLRAIDRFDVSRGVKFQSFVVPTMVGEIKNYFRDYNQPIKISRRNSEAIIKMKQILNELTIVLEKAPTTKQLAEKMNISQENALELLETANNIKIASLDLKIDENDENDYKAKLGDYDKGFEMIEIREIIKQSLNILDEKEKYIITQRFFNNKSQQTIAHDLNVSQMYVSRAEKRALNKMREAIKN